MIQLDDVERIAAERPETFRIASREMRERLRPGDLIKLHFRHVESGHVERMWVAIHRVAADGYHGVLDNDPTEPIGIEGGEPVRFLPRHVSHIWIEAHHDWPARLQEPPNMFVET